MIARITGEILDVRPNHIIVNVHGIGYLVAVPSNTGYSIGNTIVLHTHLAVRENALDLYGFNTVDTYSMFELLIKLPKIGPKTALQILSQADITTLKQAVRTNDATYLSKVSGIGKKSAEKIVIGLRDILPEEMDVEHIHHNSDSDVIDALITLGYSQKSAYEAVQKIPQDITETNARIKHALKYVT